MTLRVVAGGTDPRSGERDAPAGHQTKLCSSCRVYVDAREFVRYGREFGSCAACRERRKRWTRDNLGYEEQERVPAGPWLAWMRERIDRDFEGQLAAFALWIGKNERAVRRQFRQENTTLGFVDEALCHAGLPHVLNDLYPVDLGEDAA